MTKNILAHVRRELRDNRGRLPFIAEKTGIPYHTIIKIHLGHTKNPGVNTVQTLYDYFTEPPENK